MTLRLIEKCRAFLRERKGVSSVEFAVLAPITFLVLAVALESMRLSIAYTLIDHAVFIGIYDAKLYRGVNAEKYVKDQLEEWRFGLYDPKDIKLTFTNAASMAEVQKAGTAGAGAPGASVHLRVEMELGILKDVLPESSAMKGSRELNIYYMNESGESSSGDENA